MRPRAKISNVGVACVLGIGNEDVTLRDKEAFNGAVPHFEPSQYVSQRKSLKLMSRASLLGVAASKLALASTSAANVALFMSVGMSGGEISNLSGMLSESLNDRGQLDLKQMGERGLSRINPLLSFHVLNNMPLCHTSIELGIKGPHGAFYAENTARGLRALARAALCVEREEARLALAGGADSPLDTINLALSNNTHTAEGAAMMLFGQEGDIEWLGLSEHKQQSEQEALQSLTNESPAVQLRSTQVKMFGDTQAASAALLVARAIALLRASSVNALAAVFAIDEEGLSAALLRRFP